MGENGTEMREITVKKGFLVYYLGIKFDLLCIPEDNFTLMPNFSLGSPKCKKNVPPE